MTVPLEFSLILLTVGIGFATYLIAQLRQDQLHPGDRYAAKQRRWDTTAGYWSTSRWTLPTVDDQDADPDADDSQQVGREPAYPTQVWPPEDTRVFADGDDSEFER